MEFDEDESSRPLTGCSWACPAPPAASKSRAAWDCPRAWSTTRCAGLSPESREARDLIAYLHRSRDEMERSSARRATKSRNSKPNAARCRRNGSIARKSASPNSKRSFIETQKRLEGEVARLAADMKDRDLRAQIGKAVCGAALGKLASDARAEADAAVLETLAASQADLGVAPEEHATPFDAVAALPPDSASACGDSSSR